MPTLLSHILSFLFPPECLGCGEEDFLICPKCQKNIPVKRSAKSLRLFPFQKIFVFTDYENPLIKAAIKRWKFGFSKRVLVDLTPFLKKEFPQNLFPLACVFVPVPLHWRRKNKRGFNQSLLLAMLFCDIHTGKSQVQNLLQRIRHTPHQSHLPKKERIKNIENAFKIKKSIASHISKNTPLVLVDDVTTTGSTLLECAKILYAEGYHYIWGLVLARGEMHS